MIVAPEWVGGVDIVMFEALILSSITVMLAWISAVGIVIWTLLFEVWVPTVVVILSSVVVTAE